MKAYLFNMHLLVPRSRLSAKVKVKYKGYISQKWSFWGHSCFTNTSCLFMLLEIKLYFVLVILQEDVINQPPFSLTKPNPPLTFHLPPNKFYLILQLAISQLYCLRNKQQRASTKYLQVFRDQSIHLLNHMLLLDLCHWFPLHKNRKVFQKIMMCVRIGIAHT